MASEQELKRTLLKLLLTDEEFRASVITALTPYFVRKVDLEPILKEIRRLREDFNSLVEEIVRLREDFNKRMEALDKKFMKVITELREDFNKHMEAFQQQITQQREDFNKRMEALDKKFVKTMTELREDFNRRMEAMDAKVSALATRYGIMTEETFRNALRGLLEEKLGCKVERWEEKDLEGIVYGHPSVVEVDVIIAEDGATLIEITSHARKSDVAILARKAKFFEKVTGKRVKEMIIVSPFMDERAKAMAKMLGIKVYTASDII